ARGLWSGTHAAVRECPGGPAAGGGPDGGDTVKTKGALLYEPGADWKVEEIELGDPRQGEVTVELAASGLCHSDEHLRTGGTPVASYPAIGGHEGAGVVTKVGPGVTGLQEGDH